MKRVTSFFMLLILIFSFTTSTNASEIVSTTSIGPAKEQFDWPQGLTVVGDTYYVLDGNDIRAGKLGKWETVFNMGSLKPLLPYELQNDMVIRSFRLAEMKHKEGALYVSGLLYKDRQGENVPYPSGGIAVGETYTILFKVDKGTARILYLDSVALNRQMQPDDFYETKSGGPENLYRWGPNTVIYNYALWVYRPNFTFMDNADIIMTRRYYNETEWYPYVHILQISEKGKAETIYEIKDKKKLLRSGTEWGKWPNYVIATRDKDLLTIYDGIVFMYYVDLKTGEMKVDELSDQYFMERPVFFKNHMYFLNDEGIYTWKRSGPYYDYYHLMTAESFKLPILIADWDYDGYYIYLLSYDKRAIYKIKA
ncbi:hypothetical protein ACQKK5_23370 [Brevibacillus panacihumi]|uniref:hypothetical protein n=1 Tax=Brevibacillus panacihumi TaxID=497735 RepID=UPI003D086927